MRVASGVNCELVSLNQQWNSSIRTFLNQCVYVNISSNVYGLDNSPPAYCSDTIYMEIPRRYLSMPWTRIESTTFDMVPIGNQLYHLFELNMDTNKRFSIILFLYKKLLHYKYHVIDKGQFYWTIYIFSSIFDQICSFHIGRMKYSTWVLWYIRILKS